VAQVVEHLPSKPEALSSNLFHKKERKKERKTCQGMNGKDGLSSPSKCWPPSISAPSLFPQMTCDPQIGCQGAAIQDLYLASSIPFPLTVSVPYTSQFQITRPHRLQVFVSSFPTPLRRLKIIVTRNCGRRWDLSQLSQSLRQLSHPLSHLPQPLPMPRTLFFFLSS
jgi:hypothetical protein